MTNQEKRIKIAEAVGKSNHVGLKKRGLWWRPDSKGYTSSENEAGRYSREEASRISSVRGDWDDVTIHEFTTPDYLNDLNVMHEARKALSETQKADYARILKSLTWTSEQPEYCAIDATAEQHAEAFGITLNLWK